MLTPLNNMEGLLRSIDAGAAAAGCLPRGRARGSLLVREMPRMAPGEVDAKATAVARLALPVSPPVMPANSARLLGSSPWAESTAVRMLALC